MYDWSRLRYYFFPNGVLQSEKYIRFPKPDNNALFITNTSFRLELSKHAILICNPVWQTVNNRNHKEDPATQLLIFWLTRFTIPLVPAQHLSIYLDLEIMRIPPLFFWEYNFIIFAFPFAKQKSFEDQTTVKSKQGERG